MTSCLLSLEGECCLHQARNPQLLVKVGQPIPSRPAALLVSFALGSGPVWMTNEAVTLAIRLLLGLSTREARASGMGTGSGRHQGFVSVPELKDSSAPNSTGAMHPPDCWADTVSLSGERLRFQKWGRKQNVHTHMHVCRYKGHTHM